VAHDEALRPQAGERHRDSGADRWPTRCRGRVRQRANSRGLPSGVVFDIEQTEGEPLPEPREARGDPGIRTASLKSTILAQNIVLESVSDLGGALGTSSGGHIRLLTGLSPAVQFATLVHEYAHLCSAVGYVQLSRQRLGPSGTTQRSISAELAFRFSEPCDCPSPLWHFFGRERTRGPHQVQGALIGGHSVRDGSKPGRSPRVSWPHVRFILVNLKSRNP
jgi:hypothetical protein